MAGQHSGDGSWWWSGSEWLPAWSNDRRLWFNGVTWVRVQHRKPFPRPRPIEWGMATAWFVLGVASVVWSGVASAQQDRAGLGRSTAILTPGFTLAAVGVTLLIACSYLLAHSRRWLYLGLLTVGVWALGIALYVVAMLAAPITGPTDANDTAAGAGVVILGIPLLLVIGVIVAIGVGASAVVERLSTRRPGPLATD